MRKAYYGLLLIIGIIIFVIINYTTVRSDSIINEEIKLLSYNDLSTLVGGCGNCYLYFYCESCLEFLEGEQDCDCTYYSKMWRLTTPSNLLADNGNTPHNVVVCWIRWASSEWNCEHGIFGYDMFMKYGTCD